MNQVLPTHSSFVGTLPHTDLQEGIVRVCPHLRPFQACVSPRPIAVSCKLGMHVTCRGKASPFRKEETETTPGEKLNLYEQIKNQWSKHQVLGHIKNQLWIFNLSQINLSCLKLTLFFSFFVLHRCFPKRERPSLQNKKSLYMVKKYLLPFWSTLCINNQGTKKPYCHSS